MMIFFLNTLINTIETKIKLFKFFAFYLFILCLNIDSKFNNNSILWTISI